MPTLLPPEETLVLVAAVVVAEVITQSVEVELVEIAVTRQAELGEPIPAVTAEMAPTPFPARVAAEAEEEEEAQRLGETAATVEFRAVEPEVEAEEPSAEVLVEQAVEEKSEY